MGIIRGPGFSQSLCGACPFQSLTGDVVLVVVDVASICTRISAPHNALVASLGEQHHFSLIIIIKHVQLGWVSLILKSEYLSLNF